MTDLERARIVGGIIDAYTLAPNDEDEKREAVARQVNAALAAARREGFEEGRRAKRETLRRTWGAGAEEMRKRAVHTARTVIGSGSGTGEYIAQAIEALPLAPEEPT